MDEPWPSLFNAKILDTTTQANLTGQTNGVRTSSDPFALPPPPKMGPSVGLPATPISTTPQTAYGADSTWQATTGTVSDNETVNKQLQNLLSSNSPYIDQAKQRAYQYANARGLQNSSLAASAGEEAAIAQALPIAQADAATYNRQALANQQVVNQAAQTNAQTREAARQTDNELVFKQQSLLESRRQFDADLLNKRQTAQLDADTKAYLSKVEAQYKTVMQTSASAAEAFKQYQQSLVNIMTNKDMDAANKQAALDMLGGALKDSMDVSGAIAGLDLSTLLSFNGGGGSGSGGSYANVPQPTAPQYINPYLPTPGVNPNAGINGSQGRWFRLPNGAYYQEPYYGYGAPPGSEESADPSTFGMVSSNA
ncbi:MAG TPA: hypothetical protein VFS42_06875 [Burkholderiaceae bacterium]|nr:hypothetical protein [Burkholderiaceae bacterium]